MKRVTGMMLLLFALIAAGGCATPKRELPVYVPNEGARIVRFRQGAEPQGFNGILWGTELSSLQGMRFHRTDPSYGGIDFYVRKGETLLLGSRVRTVQYGFWRDRFYAGMAAVDGLPQWKAFKEAVFKTFGEGAKPFRNREEYLWVGRDAVMALQYDETLEEGVYYIRSDAMSRKIWSDYPWKTKK